MRRIVSLHSLFDFVLIEIFYELYLNRSITFTQILFECRFTAKASLKRHLVIHVNYSNGGENDTKHKYFCLSSLNPILLSNFSFVELKIEKIDDTFYVIQSNGGGGEPIEIGRNLYKCDECDQVFASQFYLREHRATHSNVCEICSRKFRTSAELDAHRQQGCVRLIDIGSIAVNCKPTAVDAADELHCDDNEPIGNDLIDMEQQSESMNANNKDEKSPDLMPKEPQHQGHVSGKKCTTKYKLEVHQRNQHRVYTVEKNVSKDGIVLIDGEWNFKCPLCDIT